MGVPGHPVRVRVDPVLLTERRIDPFLGDDEAATRECEEDAEGATKTETERKKEREEREERKERDRDT